jgi:hypothetical protein
MEKFIENNNLNVPKKSRAYGKWSGEQAVMAGLFYYAFNRS